MRLGPGGGALERRRVQENLGRSSYCKCLPGILQESPKAGRGLAKAF